MEAIKNFLKPGDKNDNQTLYDTSADPNKGKVSGEGSHFSHGQSDSGVGGLNSPTSTTNPASGLTGSSATKTAEPTSTSTSGVASEQAPIGTASTTTDNRAFPLSNTGTGSTANPSSQAGVGGQDYSNTDRTAAGTLPAAAIASQQTTSATTHPSTSSTTQPISGSAATIQQGIAPQSDFSSGDASKIHAPAQPADDNCTDIVHGGPHVTQIARKIDPCYEDQSSVGVPPTIGSTSTTSQPTTTTTSTSRSDALAPGVTATQTGAGPTTAALAGEVPREPRATTSTVDSSAFGSTTGATGSSATKTADPVANTSTQRSLENTAPTQHNSSSLAGPAAVGAGAGLAGASIAGSQHGSGQTHVDSHDGRPSAGTASTVPTTASSGIAGSNANTTSSVAHPYSEKAVDPRIDSEAHRAAGASTGTSQYQTLDPAAEQRAAPVNKEQEHHYGRDAAVGGAAGAGAGALAEHEYSKKEAENQVKEQKAAEKEHEKEVKHAEKEHEKEVKQAEKEHEKEVKHAEKEHEKEQKQHEKEIAKEQKQHEKEAKQHEKELEKERKQQEKAEKPGLLDRLLHRGDSKKEKHTEEAAAAGAATGAGAAGVHEHNKLHKDPPAGYGQEPTKGYASQVTGGTNTTALAQGNENILPAGSSTHEPLPGNATVPGTRYGSGHDEHPTATSAPTQPEYYQNDPTQGIKRDSVSAAGGTIQSTTPYQPAPQKGYASQVTGGTGTTQLASGNLDPLTNPTKSNPLDQGTYGPQGYASTVTGGTGTTQLAQGTTSEIPTTGMAPGRSGSVAGVETQTPYVDGPKAGSGKYADQVTGGTGTTQLAQGQESEVANPQSSSLADKLEGALALK